MSIDLAKADTQEEVATETTETTESRKEDTPAPDPDAEVTTDDSADDAALEGDGAEVTDGAEATDDDVLLTAGIEGLTRDEEGMYVLAVNPDDPSYGVFKGKDQVELLQNIRKGKVASEEYIRELKATQTDKAIKDRIRSRKEDEPLADVVIPVFENILVDTAQRMRVDPQMFAWGKQEWKDLSEADGMMEAYDAKQRVEKARQVAEATFAQQNLDALNDINLREELSSASELLSEYNVGVDDINLDGILDTIESTKSNFTSQGLRRHGRIVAAVTREINRLATPKTEKKIAASVQEKIAKATAKKRKAARTTGDTSGRPNPTSKQTTEYASTQEAMNAALKEWQLAQRK